MTLDVVGKFAGQLGAYAVEMTVLCLLGSWLVRRFGQTRRIFALPLAKGQLAHELRSAARVAVFDTALALALVQTGVVRFGRAPLGVSLAVFAVHFAFFEFWFYVTHVARHRPFLYRFHAVHHRSRVCHPLTNFSASVVDRMISSFGFWLPLVVAARLGVLTPLATALVLAVSTLGNILIHANVEVFPALERAPMAELLVHSVSSHALHHARVKGNYGQFTAVFDKLFGTYIADTPRVTARAFAGHPLRALQERAEGGPERPRRTRAAGEPPCGEVRHRHGA